jgi:predicted metal-dependent hydrolase
MAARKYPRSRKRRLIEGAHHHDDKPAIPANMQPLEETVPVSVFRGEVAAWARRVGVEPREIRLRPMKRKWASCSSRGRLTFDTGLLAQPAQKRAEVIVHELLHLRIPNHGKLFESLLRGYIDSSV